MGTMEREVLFNLSQLQSDLVQYKCVGVRKVIVTLYVDLCGFVYPCIIIIINGTVSAKIAPRLKCYKNASRLYCYNFPTDNAIDFLISPPHSEMV